MLNIKPRQPCSRKRLTHAQNIKSCHLPELPFGLFGHASKTQCTHSSKTKKKFRSMVSDGEISPFWPMKLKLFEFWPHVAKDSENTKETKIFAQMIFNIF